MERSPTDPSETEPLWDVVEEHLDEAEFCQEEFERMLDHPLFTLDHLATGIEDRMLAHVDGLVLGGMPVAERLLVPAIEEATEADAARATVATLALLRGPKPAAIGAGLFHEREGVRAAALRACLIAPSARLEAWAIDRFRERKDPNARAVLLRLIGHRLEAPVVLACLDSDHAGVQAAAAHVVARGERGSFGPAIERLLQHSDEAVRDCALIAALAWGLPSAWQVCERAALDSERDAPAIASLSAALGGPGHHARLAKLLDNPRRKVSALVALGYTGDPARVPQLVELTGSADALEAKLAARAISLITGLDLNDETYLRKQPPARQVAEEEPDEDETQAGEVEGLPPLEDDDLDADLVPPPLAALPEPDAAAIAEFWRRSSAQFEARQRYLCGQRFGADAVLDFLERGQLGPRHTIALAFGIRTGGRAWLDTRGSSAAQRSRLAVLRTSDIRHFTNFFDR